MESHRSHRVRYGRAESLGKRAAVRASESGTGRRLHCQLGRRNTVTTSGGRSLRFARVTKTATVTRLAIRRGHPWRLLHPFPTTIRGTALREARPRKRLRSSFGVQDSDFEPVAPTCRPEVHATTRHPFTALSPVSRSYWQWALCIYVGYHFRNAVTEGIEHGRKIAEYGLPALLATGPLVMSRYRSCRRVRDSSRCLSAHGA